MIRKFVLVSLIILLAFTMGIVLTFGKVKKDEVKNQPAELNKVGSQLKPEDFPEVVLPKPRPYWPTMDDFQREVLDHKGWTMEDFEEMKNKFKPVHSEEIFELPAEEKSPYYCRIRDPISAGICDYPIWAPPWLHCWGQIGVATYLDLDNNFFDCPYPLYPFQPVEVQILLFASDTCTIISEAKIYSADYSGGGPYPDSELCSSDKENPLVFHHPGGFDMITVPLDTITCCLNEPFFGVWVFNNSDDFYDTVNCTPKYSCWLSWTSVDCEQFLYESYWNPNGLDSVWYDVWGFLEFIGAKIEVLGYTAPQNPCEPPEETWYFKDPQEPAAPFGIPDFNQFQMPHNAYCGPSAGANSIWWFVTRGDFEPFWGSLDPSDVPALIAEIATLAGTTTDGTECDALQQGIINTIYAHGGWWFHEETYYGDDTLLTNPGDMFWIIQKELKACEDVVLLLGFWQQNPDSSWTRFGGHFVTAAGVDIYNLALAFSDPAIDGAEFAMTPGNVLGTHTPTNDPQDHNTGQVSHDFYDVAWPSDSPGGFVWLPDYVVPWQDFQGQNFRTKHLPNTGTYNDALPVHVEIEQAIVVSPGPKYMKEKIESSYAYQEDNNYGGLADWWWVYFAETSDYISGGSYGSYILGTEQADINCSYGDYYPEESFIPMVAPAINDFFVEGAAGDYKVSQLTMFFRHSDYDLYVTHYVFGFSVPEGGNQECGRVFEHVFVVENKGTSDITGLYSGIINDLDIGDNACEVGIDSQHQSMWMWDATDSTYVFGMTKKPAFVGDYAFTGWGLANDARIHNDQYLDSLIFWLQSGTWQVDNQGTFDDKSFLIGNNSFNLPAGGILIEKWIKWGYYAETGGANAMADGLNHFLYSVLHQEGFYRGDINKDGWLTVGDVVYLINYMFKGGPTPKEFESQADFNNDDAVSVSDVVRMVSFMFKGGPAPKDKNRFFLESPYVDSTHKTAYEVRDPGLFGDPDWKDLGH